MRWITAGELVGRYTTRDSRAPKAELTLNADKIFSLSNWPDRVLARSGKGRWTLDKDYMQWKLTLTFSPRSASEGEFALGVIDVVGRSPPYQISMYLGDPDTGAVIMSKRVR